MLLRGGNVGGKGSPNGDYLVCLLVGAARCGSVQYGGEYVKWCADRGAGHADDFKVELCEWFGLLAKHGWLDWE
ncbi:hypothetical protein FB459_2057 [Yimella lutea]|uniref:Uncharacterized protein n=1 Tax=Yimella lutea TaxID=587872 RepID=A0A542EGZ9_9MICO|nr:hypothetical protein FB459_2057 [Yimella lutea]